MMREEETRAWAKWVGEDVQRYERLVLHEVTVLHAARSRAVGAWKAGYQSALVLEMEAAQAGLVEAAAMFGGYARHFASWLQVAGVEAT